MARLTDEDGKDYVGPVELFCENCNQDRLTLVWFDPESIVCTEIDSMIDVRVQGERRCSICRSSKVGLRYIAIELTIDTKDIQND